MKTSITTLAMLALLLLGCAEEATAPDLEFTIEIVAPDAEARIWEGDLVRLEADVGTTGSDFDFAETVVVWSSDVLGVLSSAVEGCEEDACWLSEQEATGGWPLVTELSAGSHVVTARALDLKGGRVEPATAAAIVTVERIEAPEIHLVAPLEGSEIVTATDFQLNAWISDDDEGEVDVSWSSSVHGVVAESTVTAPGTYQVDCRAGGVGTDDDPCHLSPGSHVMILVATDLYDDGGTSHSFLTLHVVGPTGEEE